MKTSSPATQGRSEAATGKKREQEDREAGSGGKAALSASITRSAFTRKRSRCSRQSRKGRIRPEHHEAIAGIAARLIDAGMDYYFLRPLRLGKVGFVVEQSAGIASAGASRILATVTRNVLLRMNRTQLLAVCEHVRHLME